MKTVREIYNFFQQYFTNGGKQLPLMDFLNTVPGFVEKNDDDTESMNMSMGMEYYKICEKMVEDSLLIRIKPNANIITKSQLYQFNTHRIEFL